MQVNSPRELRNAPEFPGGEVELGDEVKAVDFGGQVDIVFLTNGDHVSPDPHGRQRRGLLARANPSRQALFRPSSVTYPIGRALAYNAGVQ